MRNPTNSFNLTWSESIISVGSKATQGAAVACVLTPLAVPRIAD